MSRTRLTRHRRGRAGRRRRGGFCRSPREGGGEHPVTLIGYEDASAYCAWLASKTGRPARLPTEAEWEKAARGGLEGKKFPWGDTLDPECAHFLPHAGMKAERGTAPVASYPANP